MFASEFKEGKEGFLFLLVLILMFRSNFFDSFTKFSHRNYLMQSTFCNRNRNFHMLRDKYVVLNLSYNFYKYNLKYRSLGRSYHFTERVYICSLGERNTHVRINEISWWKIGLGAIDGQSRLIAS